MGNILINDEPVDHDGLGRKGVIDNLAAALEQCETPFVMAVNGGWGTGKTSILKCLEKIFKKKNKKSLRTVWFSPWRFQFEDSPAVSLLQQIRSTAEEENWISKDKAKRETLKLLNIAGTLAGEIVLNTVTAHSVSTKDIMSQGAAFEEKYFEAKQLTSRMQEEFQKAIEELVGKKGRLVFFIDDLDRCLTINSLRLLEALKLFLNANNCVYVIAIDMAHLTQNLEKEHKVANPLAYMKKIFQLVYTLPVPDHGCSRDLVKVLLDKNTPGIFDENELRRICYDLERFMGDNPRSLKHFCNRFLLERSIIKGTIVDDYDSMLHIFLQILQQCFPTVFELVRQRHVIIVHPDPVKDFDKFTWKWHEDFFDKLTDYTEDLYIECPQAGKYFELMPCLPEKSALEEPYKFVTVTLRDSSRTGILCLEDVPENKKIEAGANLSKMEDLSGTLLRNLNLSGCMLDLCIFDKADMTGADLSNSDCSGSTFENTLFDGGDASGTLFERADLTGLSFDGAEFTGADFTGAEMDDALRKIADASEEDEQ